ncbi:serine/threonine protein kinase [Micromonospora craterilacus]|uniref:serine/threonine protein kinase n=1 Tax=Micromonospora craterilacus TaxID=1655439 RepID=UPI001F2A7E27|nr:serine/threonine protein kinase [Micromonospora craterilacus]
MSETQPRIVAGRYRLVRLLGAGGMGRVWHARDETLRRDVAVKELVFPPGLSESERYELRERVLREARAVARIDQPNVVRIHDVLYDGEPWIVMELVPSRTLSKVVADEGLLSPARAATIGLGILAALRAAHDAGILHRDVKPANVLLADNGRIVLTDFGLATAFEDPRMTHSGIVVGSPSYLAPERATDGIPGPAADLWSLGATLYTIVEGRTPYQRSSTVATFAALATELPRPPQQAGALTAALDGLLRKDPNRRADADEAERLLRLALGPETSASATPPTAAARPRRASTAPRAWDAPDAVASKRRPTGRLAVLLVTTVAVLVVAVFSAPSVWKKLRAASAGSVESTPPTSPPPTSPPAAPDTSVTPTPSTPSTASPTPSVTTTSGPATTKASAVATSGPATTKATSAPNPTTAARTPLTPKVKNRLIRNLATGKCIIVPDSNPDTTTPIYVWECFDADGQMFTLPGDGTLRVLDKCLELTATQKGSTLRVDACDGNTLQSFSLSNTGDLVSVRTGRCIEATEGNTDNGVWLRTWDCNGADYQKWRIS